MRNWIIGKYILLLFWSCSPVMFERWITCYIIACPCDRLDATQRFEQGHAGIMWPPRWEAPCSDKNQVQISNVCLSLSLFWVACGPLLSSYNSMSYFPIALFLVCTGRSLSSSLSVHLSVRVGGRFALPAELAAMTSVKKKINIDCLIQLR